MSHAQDLTDHVVAELRAENLLLRQLLWIWHGCIIDPLAANPRELHCEGPADGHGPIDFKRDSARAIQDALQLPSLTYIAWHQDDTCVHCGVTRWTWDASKPCPNGTHEWQSKAVEP